jgi:Tfp pilus assembly protein PilO
MDTTARTYRYLDEEEINAAKKASEKEKKDKKGGGK